VVPAIQAGGERAGEQGGPPGELEAALQRDDAAHVSGIVGAERGDHLGADGVHLGTECLDVGGGGAVERGGHWFFLLSLVVSRIGRQTPELAGNRPRR